MQYFQAVQKGKQRASRSQMRLFGLAGFAMLTLTTKKGEGGFAPVGEEDHAAMIKTPDGFVVILADEDGYTKAQTKALEKDEAVQILQKAVGEGIPEFEGEEVLIWNQSYPTIRS